MLTDGGVREQDLEAGHHRIAERWQVVAAFESPDRPAVGVLDRPTLDQRGELAIAFGRDLKASQRIVLVSVEPGGYQQQLRVEFRQCRPDLLFPGAEKQRIAAATGERHVEDVAMCSALSRTAGPRIEGVLMGRRVENLGVVFKTVLRAIAVADIEVEDGDAANAFV